jgi:redox-sensitive bicupin YhaK (pirin superfamily)
MPAFVTKPLGFPWVTADPFLFCVHHDDAYPRGDERMAPVASLAGRDLGADFSRKDGWSMYHGEEVPGFPAHPHRGFETVTIARRGFIDHSDSLGATARFGGGDVQWLTAGRGIVHCEMFPLLERERDNPAELFQIWLNLPRDAKLAEPHFAMLWHDAIPRRTVTDGAGRTSELVFVAGDPASPPPPPSSWAARAPGNVSIWTIAMTPGAELTLPAGAVGANRTLYFFAGAGARIDGVEGAGRAGPGLRRRAGGDDRQRRRGRRAAHARGPADRRAGGAARAVRDEHRRRDPPGPSPTTSGRSSAAGRGPAPIRSTRATPVGSRGVPTARSSGAAVDIAGRPAHKRAWPCPNLPGTSAG